MNKRDIEVLFAYNRWANDQLLMAAAPLSRDDFASNAGASYGSIQGTFVHVLWVEWLWLQRWRGESPKQFWAADDFPDLAAISARWTDVERQQTAFIELLAGEQLTRRVTYLNLQGERWEYPLAHMMQHVVNHSSYHRGQIVTLLRQLGKTPPATDFLVFFDAIAAI
ncbi:MAG: DinB family protein [Gemmatimonadota bacterium]